MSTKIYFLIGMMGVGKSSIGLGAARKLDFAFVDLDDYIRKHENQSINDIFKNKGETAFREMEHQYLTRLEFGDAPFALVSTGGGTPVYHDNMEYMNSHGRTIWLETPLSIIIERLKDMKDDRPLISSIQNQKMEEHLRKMYESRLPYFNKANLKLQNIGYDHEVIDKLVGLIRNDISQEKN